MSLLTDKYYENLDFLSQTVEPYHHPIMDVIEKLPQTVSFSIKELESFVVTNNWLKEKVLDEYEFSSAITRKISSILAEAGLEPGMTNKMKGVDIYRLSSDTSISYDKYADELTGSVSLVKNERTSVLGQEYAKQSIIHIIDRIDYVSYRHDRSSKRKLIDLLMIFDSDEESLKKASLLKNRDLFYLVTRRLRELFSPNNSHYRVRSFDAALKISENITMYLTSYDPDLESKAMANLTLFKMILDKGNAIYQLQEIK